MKRILFAVFALVGNTVSSLACTNLIVGKKASVDGSVIASYNCDGYGGYGTLSFYPGGHHNPDEKVAIYRGWGDYGEIAGYIPQPEYTYNVVGQINENQVTILETTFDGRLELENPEGWLNYYFLMRLGLMRAKTAKDAIKIMTDLVTEYGYSSSGETLTIADKNEVWILELIGKGPGRKGAVWVALRVPDDCICAHANLSRIRQFPQTKKIDKKLGFYNVGDSVYYSTDVISFAREKGFYSGSDADFSFRDAYCPIDFENVRYADARVYSFFRHHTNKEEMDSYLPYINGEYDKCDHLPLWIRPAEKVSVRDIMNDMRDHFEGTPLDMTADISAGPWASPYRAMPMQYKTSEGKTYFTERPIGTQKTIFSVVSQLRDWLPDYLGGIQYFNCDDATMIAYVPVYCCTNAIPYAFSSQNEGTDHQFSFKSAFWINNLVANMIYPRWNVMIGDLRDAQKELEDFYEQDQKEVEKHVEGITRTEAYTYLTNKTRLYTEKMMDRWQQLFELIAVKHNDQIMQKSENGRISPGWNMSYPGYSQQFYDQVGKDTGDRYLMKKAIERRER